MGLKIFKIRDERDALELKCDSPTHNDETPTGWFDCGSHTGNLALAMTSGWRERRNAKGTWFCPQCAQRNAKKRRGSKNVPKKAASADRDLDAAKPSATVPPTHGSETRCLAEAIFCRDSPSLKR